jgi:hypothetical protein
LGSVHRHDGDFYVIADSQRFTGSSRQYQHGFDSAEVCVRTVSLL